MGWRWLAIKHLIKVNRISLRSLCRRDYVYNTPLEPIERLAENEYLKYCHWVKEADQLEKDVRTSFHWMCNSTIVEEYELSRDVMELFMTRHDRVQRMIVHLSRGFAEKYGRSPTVPSIIEKNGFVRIHKEMMNDQD